MTASLRLRLAAFALSLAATGALVACGSVAEGNGNSPEVASSSTIVDPKPGEHEALAPTNNDTSGPATVCASPDCVVRPPSTFVRRIRVV